MIPVETRSRGERMRSPVRRDSVGPMRCILPFVIAALACGAPPRRAPPAPPPSAPPPKAASPPMSDPAEYVIATATRAAGEAIFTRTGIGDPYRTGVPYPMWLALQRAYPARFGGNPQQLAAKFGFIARAPNRASVDLDEREGLPVGMHLT